MLNVHSRAFGNNGVVCAGKAGFCPWGLGSLGSYGNYCRLYRRSTDRSMEECMVFHLTLYNLDNGSFLLLFKAPKADEVPRTSTITKSVYTNKNVWLLSAVFLLFNMAAIAVKSYMPLFLESERGVSEITAAQITSLIMVFALIASPLTGLLLAKTRSPRILLTTGLSILIINSLLLFNSSVSLIIIIGLLVT
jgi:nitrate/nitrite transporter NarK